MNEKTYTCVICTGINAAEKLHCSSCGTIPAKYSVLGKPSTIVTEDYFTRFIEVTVAFGAERQNHIRSVKHELRTVPGDYYAEV
jgi:hypothetical protein